MHCYVALNNQVICNCRSSFLHSTVTPHSQLAICLVTVVRSIVNIAINHDYTWCNIILQHLHGFRKQVEYSYQLVSTLMRFSLVNMHIWSVNALVTVENVGLLITNLLHSYFLWLSVSAISSFNILILIKLNNMISLITRAKPG